MTGSPEEADRKVFYVDAGSDGHRIDQWLAAQLPDHVSRNRVQAMIREGAVAINGNPVLEARRRLRANEAIELVVPKPEPALPEPERIPLDILFEDDELIVVNKPAGMVVHPAAGNWHGTLVNALLYHCGKSLTGIGGVLRPGIVHRLDKETSGILVAAKTARAHADLAAQFADHGKTRGLERRYQALVWGAPPDNSGTIRTFLGRSKSNRLRRAVVAEGAHDAKHAVTHYLVLTRCPGDKPAETLMSLVECALETGRTHQIRVHMAHIGYPLIGDREYGKHFETKANRLHEPAKQAVLNLGRQALHAAILAFEHPQSGILMRFEVGPPDDFQSVINSMKQKIGPS